jgi:hypothetical protein
LECSWHTLQFSNGGLGLHTISSLGLFFFLLLNVINIFTNSLLHPFTAMEYQEYICLSEIRPLPKLIGGFTFTTTILIKKKSAQGGLSEHVLLMVHSSKVITTLLILV